MSDVLDRVREGSAWVADRARHVRIDDDAIAELATMIPADPPPLLPEEQAQGDDNHIAAKVVAWNMVNFGSGWFPHLHKRQGLSGARSLAQAFDDHVHRHGAPRAAWLAEVDVATVAGLFEQPHPGPVDGLLELFADVHNAADNVSVGHSAWAMNAIKRYMDEVADREGPHNVDRTWHRVWSGVRATLPQIGRVRLLAHRLRKRFFGEDPTLVPLIFPS